MSKWEMFYLGMASGSILGILMCSVLVYAVGCLFKRVAERMEGGA